MHASVIREATISTRTARQPVASERRRREVRRLVTELAARLRWPPVIVAVTIPPEIVAAFRTAAGRISLEGWYEVELAGGYLEIDGDELVELCGNLVALADAVTDGDETAARRALDCLHGPWR